MLKKLFISEYSKSYLGTFESVIRLSPRLDTGEYLDCGCDDGKLTKKVASKVMPSSSYGIEISNVAVKKAKKLGIKASVGDLNNPLPFKDGIFSLVTANQVIEHLKDTDRFVDEVYRVLKPGGYFVISTNNLSSWHNIFALFLGFQPFPSDVSNTTGIGKMFKLFDGDGGSWSHLRIFTMKALVEFLKFHKFEVSQVDNIGYYPLPYSLGKLCTKIDPLHSAYTTVLAKKPF